MRAGDVFSLRAPEFSAALVGRALARLLDKLAGRDILTCGEILSVLGFTTGTMEIECIDEREAERDQVEIDARIALAEDSAAYGKIWKAIDAYADTRARQRGQWSEQLDSHKTVVDRAIQADRATWGRRAIEAALAVPRESESVPLPPIIAGVGFYVVEAVGGGWVMEAGTDDPKGPLGEACVRQGEVRETFARAAIDAWALALEVSSGEVSR